MPQVQVRPHPRPPGPFGPHPSKQYPCDLPAKTQGSRHVLDTLPVGFKHHPNRPMKFLSAMFRVATQGTSFRQVLKGFNRLGLLPIASTRTKKRLAAWKQGAPYFPRQTSRSFKPNLQRVSPSLRTPPPPAWCFFTPGPRSNQTIKPPIHPTNLTGDLTKGYPQQNTAGLQDATGDDLAALIHRRDESRALIHRVPIRGGPGCPAPWMKFIDPKD